MSNSWILHKLMFSSLFFVQIDKNLIYFVYVYVSSQADTCWSLVIYKNQGRENIWECFLVKNCGERQSSVQIESQIANVHVAPTKFLFSLKRLRRGQSSVSLFFLLKRPVWKDHIIRNNSICFPGLPCVNWTYKIKII